MSEILAHRTTIVLMDSSKYSCMRVEDMMSMVRQRAIQFEVSHSGSAQRFHLSPATRVLALKNLLSFTIPNNPPGGQCLMYKDQVLLDEQTLQEAGVPNEAMLCLTKLPSETPSVCAELPVKALAEAAQSSGGSKVCGSQLQGTLTPAAEQPQSSSDNATPGLGETNISEALQTRISHILGRMQGPGHLRGRDNLTHRSDPSAQLLRRQQQQQKLLLEEEQKEELHQIAMIEQQMQRDPHAQEQLQKDLQAKQQKQEQEKLFAEQTDSELNDWISQQRLPQQQKLEQQEMQKILVGQKLEEGRLANQQQLDMQQQLDTTQQQPDTQHSLGTGPEQEQQQPINTTWPPMQHCSSPEHLIASLSKYLDIMEKPTAALPSSTAMCASTMPHLLAEEQEAQSRRLSGVQQVPYKQDNCCPLNHTLASLRLESSSDLCSYQSLHNTVTTSTLMLPSQTLSTHTDPIPQAAAVIRFKETPKPNNYIQLVVADLSELLTRSHSHVKGVPLMFDAMATVLTATPEAFQREQQQSPEISPTGILGDSSLLSQALARIKTPVNPTYGEAGEVLCQRDSIALSLQNFSTSLSSYAVLLQKLAHLSTATSLLLEGESHIGTNVECLTRALFSTFTEAVRSCKSQTYVFIQSHTKLYICVHGYNSIRQEWTAANLYFCQLSNYLNFLCFLENVNHRPLSFLQKEGVECWSANTT